MENNKDMTDVMITLEQDDMDDGAVCVASEFRHLNSLAQADLLQDWIDQLEEIYESVTSNNFLADMAPRQSNERLH